MLHGWPEGMGSGPSMYGGGAMVLLLTGARLGADRLDLNLGGGSRDAVEGVIILLSVCG
ncbi:hypothetical protein TIFTF001_004511 [Ficus carica]|uniref:Uncharacterized protein n=1 Tax=Ficus carica TaxID=3494 RepID=A0AA88A4R9_FICCA|nr:hypothetical protein TIFTF001_004511 [Ficus carica]